MKGLWLADQSIRFRDDLERPDLVEDYARIKVELAGICGTDLELLQGYYLFEGIPGHEFVGRVEAGPDELLGQRVVGEITLGCGVCIYCQSGNRGHCSDRKVLGIKNYPGAFAEFLSLPVDNLHIIPDTLSNEHAVLVEPLAAALQVQEQTNIQATDRVLVVGAGRLGQLIALSLALRGCDLCVTATSHRKLDFLAARGIAVSLSESVEPGSYDYVIECSGNPLGFALARRALRPRATLILKSTFAGELSHDVSSLVVDEITLIGSRCGPFDKAIELLASAALDVDYLISARYALEDAVTAFGDAGDGKHFKVLLEP